MNKDDVDRVLAANGYEAPEILQRNVNDNPYCTYNEVGDTPYEYKSVDKYYQARADRCIKCEPNTHVTLENGIYTCGRGHKWTFDGEEHKYLRSSTA